jgi:hypothetical protein
MHIALKIGLLIAAVIVLVLYMTTSSSNNTTNVDNAVANAGNAATIAKVATNVANVAAKVANVAANSSNLGNLDNSANAGNVAANMANVAANAANVAANSANTADVFALAQQETARKLIELDNTKVKSFADAYIEVRRKRDRYNIIKKMTDPAARQTALNEFGFTSNQISELHHKNINNERNYYTNKYLNNEVFVLRQAGKMGDNTPYCASDGTSIQCNATEVTDAVKYQFLKQPDGKFVIKNMFGGGKYCDVSSTDSNLKCFGNTLESGAKFTLRPNRYKSTQLAIQQPTGDYCFNDNGRIVCNKKTTSYHGSNNFMLDFNV